MKTQYLLSISALLFLAVPLHAQPELLWSNTYHGRNIDEMPSIIQTSDGGYMIAGATGAWNGGNRCGFLVRTDAEGNEIWEREYEHINGFCAVIQLSDSSFMLGGNSKSSDAGKGACLLKIDAYGEQISLNVYGSSCVDVVRTWDGGFALAGTKRISGTVNDQFYLQKIDSTGIKQWEILYGENGLEWCKALIQTEDGGFALAGVTHSFKSQPKTLSQRDFYLVRTDAGGNLLWSCNYGLDERENDDCRSLVQTPDKGFALVGTTNPSIYVSQGDLYLVKTDSVGNKMWSQLYGGDGHDEGASIILLPDSGFVLVGSIGFQKKDIREKHIKDYCLVRTDPDGTELWSREFRGSGFNRCESVIQTSDGGFALIGNTSNGEGTNDFLLIKTGPVAK